MSEIKTLIEKIEAAHFEQEAGALVNFIPWMELKQRLLATPLTSPGLTPPCPVTKEP